MPRGFRIVRHDLETGRVWSRSGLYWPGMSSHDLARTNAITAADRLERRIAATLDAKNQPMPSSLIKRMDEACATDLRELKRITFPEDATLTSELTSRPRSSRFQSAFAKPAGNTTIPAEPTATVTSSTIPSYYTRFQPATSTKSADNTTTTTNTSSVGSSTIPSYYTRFQPATTKSAENTTSSVGTSTTHTRTSSVSTRSTRPSRFQQVAKPAENTTVTTTTSSESHSSYSASETTQRTTSAPVDRPSKYPAIELDPLPDDKFPRIGKTLLYDMSPATMAQKQQEDSIIVKYIKKFGTAWGDSTLPAIAQKAWEWRKRSAVYRSSIRKKEEEEFKQSGLSDRSRFVSKREQEDILSEMLQLDMPAPAPQPAPMPKPKPAPQPKIEEDSTMSTIISVMSGFTDMITATASDLYTWFSGSSSTSRTDESPHHSRSSVNLYSLHPHAIHHQHPTARPTSPPQHPPPLNTSPRPRHQDHQSSSKALGTAYFLPFAHPTTTTSSPSDRHHPTDTIRPTPSDRHHPTRPDTPRRRPQPNPPEIQLRPITDTALPPQPLFPTNKLAARLFNTAEASGKPTHPPRIPHPTRPPHARSLCSRPAILPPPALRRSTALQQPIQDLSLWAFDTADELYRSDLFATASLGDGLLL
ncbi:hypothetical protein Q7P36_005458 [Cladosporium allicinum]